MRELDLTIRVNNAEAKQALEESDRAFEKNVAAAGELRAHLELAEAELKRAAADVRTLTASMLDASTANAKQLQPELVKSTQRMLEAEDRVKTLSTQLKDQLKPALEEGGKAAKSGGDALESFGKQAMGVFAGYLSVRGVLGAIQSTSEFANNLQRMASQTGISVGALQEYAYAARLANVPTDTLTNGVTMLERRLADDPNSMKAGLRAVHLTIDDLRDSGPDVIFERIARSVMGIDDPMKRVQVATELFGRSGAQLLPVMENLDEIKNKAHDAGAVMDDSAVAAVGRLNNALDTAKTRFTVLVAEGLTPVLQRMQQIQAIADGTMGGGKAPPPPGFMGHDLNNPLGMTMGVAAAAGAMIGVGLDYLQLYEEGVGGNPSTKSQSPGDAASQLARSRAQQGNALAGQMLPSNKFPDDPAEQSKWLAAKSAAEKVETDETHRRIALEEQEEALGKRMFEERLRVNKAITGEIEKQVAAMAKTINSNVMSNFDARKRNNAVYGRDVTGAIATPADDPFRQYNESTQKIDIMKGQSPGVDVSELEKERDRTFNESMLKAATAADTVAAAQTHAATTTDSLSRAAAGAGDAFSRFTGLMVPTSPMPSDIDAHDGRALAVSGQFGTADLSRNALRPGVANNVGMGGPLVTAAGSAAGLSFGNIQVTVQGNVDNESTARRLASETSDRIVRELLARFKVPLGRS